MKERSASPIGFFQKYLTIWGALYMALATTVGVLTEVPGMLFLVKIANKTKGRFPA